MDEIGEDEDEGLSRNFLVAIFWKNKGEDGERSKQIWRFGRGTWRLCLEKEDEDRDY